MYMCYKTSSCGRSESSIQLYDNIQLLYTFHLLETTTSMNFVNNISTHHNEDIISINIMQSEICYKKS